MNVAGTRLSAEQAPSARAPIGLTGATALVIGNMIGSGVFLLPTSLAPYGLLAIAGWFCSTIGSMVLAIMFARLARVMPMTGGPYAYTRRAFGDFAGFLGAWCYWKAAWIGNAAISLSLVGYLAVFFPMLARPGISSFTAIVVVWIFTALNLTGLRLVSRLNIGFTILKLIPLVLIGLLGWRFVHIGYFVMPHLGVTVPETGVASAIATSATLTMWAFIGLESATVPAEAVHDANRTIPRATLAGTILTAVIYILSVTAVQGIIPTATLAQSSAPFATAAALIMGPGAAAAMAAVAVISTAGALLGWVLMQGQIPMAAAEDGLLPSILMRRNRHGVPANGLIISSLLVTILLLFQANSALSSLFRIIILVGTMTTLLPYALCAAAMLQFLADHQNIFGKNLIRSSLVIGCAAFCYSMWELYGAGEDAIFWGFLITFGGLPIYVWRKYRVGVSSVEGITR